MIYLTCERYVNVKNFNNINDIQENFIFYRDSDSNNNTTSRVDAPNYREECRESIENNNNHAANNGEGSGVTSPNGEIRDTSQQFVSEDVANDYKNGCINISNNCSQNGDSTQGSCSISVNIEYGSCNSVRSQNCLEITNDCVQAGYDNIQECNIEIFKRYIETNCNHGIGGDTDGVNEISCPSPVLITGALATYAMAYLS